VCRGDLAAALAHVGRALPRCPALPVLAGIRAEVTGSRLTLAAFDYDKAAHASADGANAAPGVILCDGPPLISTVKALPGGKAAPVTLKAGASALTLACDSVRAAVPALAHPEDYPSLPELPPPAGTVAGDAFARSVSRVAAAASTDATAPALMCVELGLRPGGMVTLAATDRYRLAADEMTWTPATAHRTPREILVPAACLAQFAAGCRDKVTIHAAPHQRPDSERGPGGNAGFAGFSDGTREIILHISNSAFPVRAWRDRLGGEHPTVTTVDARSLGQAVRRVGRLCGRGEPVRLEFEAAGVTVCPVRDGTECGSQTVPAATNGPVIRTGFNAGYLESMLGGIDGNARISLSTARMPALITPADSSDPFRVLVCTIAPQSDAP
jgi:DNA polymerase-3 subunit beta